MSHSRTLLALLCSCLVSTKFRWWRFVIGRKLFEVNLRDWTKVISGQSFSASIELYGTERSENQSTVTVLAQSMHALHLTMDLPVRTRRISNQGGYYLKFDGPSTGSCMHCLPPPFFFSFLILIFFNNKITNSSNIRRTTKNNDLSAPPLFLSLFLSLTPVLSFSLSSSSPPHSSAYSASCVKF